MGGATDRVYAINPKQMRVNYPRHLPGSETPGSSHGAWSEDAVLHMNVRIRLAEISRDIVDAMPPGGGDVDTLSYSKIAALDKQFEQIIASWPLQDLAFSSPDLAARRIALQRSVGILSVHARRAKLLRPLLRIRDMSEKFEPFRRQCLRSAEAVMEVSSMVLSETVDTPGSARSNGTPGPQSGGSGKASSSPYHSGIVITHVRRQVPPFSHVLTCLHAEVPLTWCSSRISRKALSTCPACTRAKFRLLQLFMACTVLATDPSLRGGAEGSSANIDPDTEKRRSQLASACRLLEKAGEKSPMALGMVKRMLGVLRRHRVHGVRQETSDEVHTTRAAPGQATSYAAAERSSTVEQQQQQQLQQQLQPQPQMMMLMQPSVSGDVQMSTGPSGVQGSWAYDVMDPNGLTGIWNDFLGATPTNNGWDQLFSELDYLSGPF